MHQIRANIAQKMSTNSDLAIMRSSKRNQSETDIEMPTAKRTLTKTNAEYEPNTSSNAHKVHSEEISEVAVIQTDAEIESTNESNVENFSMNESRNDSIIDHSIKDINEREELMSIIKKLRAEKDAAIANVEVFRNENIRLQEKNRELTVEANKLSNENVDLRVEALEWRSQALEWRSEVLRLRIRAHNENISIHRPLDNHFSAEPTASSGTNEKSPSDAAHTINVEPMAGRVKQNMHFYLYFLIHVI